MIVIEPADLLASLAADANARSRAAVTIRKRELSSFLALAAEAAGVKGHISVLLTDDATLRSLNRQYRKIDQATDVLSFPAAEPMAMSGRRGAAIAGDLAISLNTAARQAAAFGHELQIEVKVLLLHGMLHLAGLDHECDSGQMAKRERVLRKHFDLPLGLIQRAEKSLAASSKTKNRKGAVGINKLNESKDRNTLAKTKAKRSPKT